MTAPRCGNAFGWGQGSSWLVGSAVAATGNGKRIGTKEKEEEYENL